MVFNEVSLGPVLESGANKNCSVSTFHFYFSFSFTFYPFLWLVFLSAKITFLSLLSTSSFLHVLCRSHLLLLLFSTFLLLYSFVFSIAKMSLVRPSHCLSALDKYTEFPVKLVPSLYRFLSVVAMG